MANYIGAQHIIWPGGVFAEVRSDRYGYDFRGLFNPDIARPDLADLFRQVNANDQALSLTLPTARYLGNIQAARQDVAEFMDRVLAGELGQVPDNLTLELGNEYYAGFDRLYDFKNGLFHGKTAAEYYGEIASAMVEEMSKALDDPLRNPSGLDMNISVQMGRVPEEDVAIRDAMSPMALRAIDMLSHHRYAWPADDNTSRVPDVEWALDEWTKAMRAVGGSEPDLFLSGWNAASYTRTEALNDYVEAQAARGRTIDPDTIDLDGRTNAEFEKFYQNQLAAHAYGMEQAAQVLDLFSQYMAIGADAATTYGFDMIHAGAHFLEVDGKIYTFASGELLRLMFESLDGTRVLSSFKVGSPQPNSPPGPDIYAFEAPDRIVVFVSRDGYQVSDGPLTVSLSLEGLSSSVAAVWGETLSSQVLPNWRDIFGAPDNPMVDETPEANAFSVARTSQFAPRIVGEKVEFDIAGGNGIVRLVFAKSPAAIQEIKSWAGADYSLGPGMHSKFVEGTASQDGLFGEQGDDTLVGHLGNDVLLGRDGYDRLFGGAGDDLLAGQEHDDFLWGWEGDDTVFGGSGADTLSGRDGNDRMFAGLGDDRAFGESGHDLLVGGDGDDTVFGGVGRDTLGGGNGDDNLYGRGDDDMIYGEDGDDMLWAGAGDDTVFGGSGSDTLAGVTGEDRIFAGSGDDVVWAGKGEDTVFGGPGDDTLRGGEGNDRIHSGNGDDLFVGGSGVDAFVFNGGRDVIRDFEDDVDQVVLDGVALGIAGLDALGVISQFATLSSGDMVLDFGGGDQLIVGCVNHISDLADDIVIA
ncbi:MAG: calcium-binding protein [Paracoccaceae bacterium]